MEVVPIQKRNETHSVITMCMQFRVNCENRKRPQFWRNLADGLMEILRSSHNNNAHCHFYRLGGHRPLISLIFSYLIPNRDSTIGISFCEFSLCCIANCKLLVCHRHGSGEAVPDRYENNTYDVNCCIANDCDAYFCSLHAHKANRSKCDICFRDNFFSDYDDSLTLRYINELALLCPRQPPRVCRRSFGYHDTARACGLYCCKNCFNEHECLEYESTEEYDDF